MDGICNRSISRLPALIRPQNIFCREFRFANQNAELNTFVSVASNYLQLQSVRFDLYGQPKLHGDIFIPIALHRWWREQGPYGFDRSQNFGVNLALDEIDLVELQSAVTNRGGMAGKFQGRLETFGTLGKLQAKCDLHLRDFASSDPRRVSADFVAGIESGLLRMSLSANAQNSSPAKIEADAATAIWQLRISSHGTNRFHSKSIVRRFLVKLPPALTAHFS